MQSCLSSDLQATSNFDHQIHQERFITSQGTPVKAPVHKRSLHLYQNWAGPIEKIDRVWNVCTKLFVPLVLYSQAPTDQVIGSDRSNQDVIIIQGEMMTKYAGEPRVYMRYHLFIHFYCVVLRTNYSNETLLLTMVWACAVVQKQQAKYHPDLGSALIQPYKICYHNSLFASNIFPRLYICSLLIFIIQDWTNVQFVSCFPPHQNPRNSLCIMN